jgi:SnoaL-like domain
VNDAPAAAAAYVTAVNARDADALVALFAARGVLRHPVGTFDTPGAIRGFYVDLVFAAKTEVTVERVETEPGARTATVELAGRSPMSDDAVRTVDHFTVDGAGAITDLHVEFC